MKKIVTFVMALCLAAGASASPLQLGAKPQPAPKQQILPMEQNIVLPNLPKDAEIEAEVMAQMPKIRFNDPKMLEANRFAKNAIRKASQAETTNITINKVGAVFLGTLFSITQGSYTPVWELVMVSNNNDTVAIDFVGYSNKYIEGYYRNAMGAVIMAGKEEVNVTGTLQIDYKGAGTSTSPTYTFTAVLQDSIGNTYNVSGDYAFENTDKQIEVMDYGYYYLALVYYKYGQTEASNYYYSLVPLTLSDEPVTPTGETIVFNIENSANKGYYSNGSYWRVSATCDTVRNSLGFYAEGFDQMVGEYTARDFFLSYTQLYYVDTDTNKIEIYKPKSLVVSQSGDTTYFSELVMGRDGNDYQINMFYVEPKATDTISLFTYGNFADYTDEDGIFMGSAINENGSAYVSFAVYTDTPVGTYTTKDSYSAGYYDYIALFSGKDTFYYDALLDTIKVIEVTGPKKDTIDYVASILYKAQNYDDPTDVKWFQITMALVSYYKYDENTAVNQTYTEGVDNVELVTDYFTSYGCVYLYAQKADQSDFFCGVVYPEKIDATYTLPLGMYDIDNSEDYNTMYASSGYSIIKNTAYPTYYATIKNKAMDKLWFIVAGTFNVEAGKMTLNATNSQGKAVNIVFNMNITSVKEVNADKAEPAVKMMQNGQMVIVKGGKTYNALGAEIVK